MVENIKFIGIGGVGCNVLGKLPDNEKLPILALDTCVCPFNWLTFDKILCGKSLCRGLGCGGDAARGYSSAQETLSDKMNLFNDNEINIFVFGLGGGTGTGIIQFILEHLNETNNQTGIKNKCNILFCTFPLNVETGRIPKANKALETIKHLVELTILVKLEDLSIFKKENILNVWQIFEATDLGINAIIQRILKMDNSDFFRYVEEYSKDKDTLEIKRFEDFQNYFSDGKKISQDNISSIDTHFTGQGRDIEQLKAITKYLNGGRKIMFVGCSTGEEIIDFQNLSLTRKMQCYGVDYDPEIVEQANQRKYIYPTKVILADILKRGFINKVNNETKCDKFDMVICRNLLIYYQGDNLIHIVERLACMTNDLLILGVSDPFPFGVKDNRVEIENLIFEVVDFDNKILRKIC